MPANLRVLSDETPVMLRRCNPQHDRRETCGQTGTATLRVALTVNGYVINFAKSDGGAMNRRGFIIAMRLLGLGWYVAIAIVLGIAGGIWLDNRTGTLPLFTLLGVLLGTVAAFYGLYRMVEPLFKGVEDTDDQ